MSSDNSLILLPHALGADFISEHGDGTEIPIRSHNAAEFEDVRHLVRSVHLPFGRDGRINFADPSEEIREKDAHVSGVEDE